MIDLKDFDFRPHPVSGWQATANFANGFGVSILPESDNKSYELAVFRGGNICYDSGITEDVLRFRTVDEVHNLVQRVRNLKEGTRVEPSHPFVTVF